MHNRHPIWLSLFFYFIGVLCFLSLIEIDPSILDSDTIYYLKYSFEILLYVLLALSFFLILTILRGFKKMNYAGPNEIIGITGIVFSLLLIFANLYRIEGLYFQGEKIIPDWKTAIYISINMFTSNGFSDFTPTPSIRMYVALETLIGFIMIPVIMTVGFMIYQRPDRN